MTTRTPHPQQDQAADYVLEALSDAEESAFEKQLETEAALQLEVKELTDAAAAISLTAKQVLPPSRQQVRLIQKPIAKHDESKSRKDTDVIE